jgi:hypothetical protein
MVGGVDAGQESGGGEIHRFLSEIPSLSTGQWDLIGDFWRQVAERRPAMTPPEANVQVAAAVREAKLRPTLSWLVEAVRSEDLGPTPDDLVIEAVRLSARARNVASKFTANSDAQEAVAGMTMVLLLRAWISETLLENVGAPFTAVRPGWPLESEGAG